jgi:Domain of unknown function (DUF4123)
MLDQSIEPWRESWDAAVARDAALQLFAIVDAAQDRRAVLMMLLEGVRNECLFGYDLDSPIAHATPRLVSVSPESQFSAWLFRTMRERPIATLIASTSQLPALASHFRRCIDVELDGLGSMYLALWDPAILGTLVGQLDDETLHVPGPALTKSQLTDVVAPLVHWWYFDRSDRLHDAVPPEMRAVNPDRFAQKLVLDADQVDQLVEASVPDHLLQHIRQNQPELLERLPATLHYGFARQQLGRARAHGLKGTGDLVNYLSLALAFGSAFDEQPSMGALLEKVRAGSITFDEALGNAPEAELEASAKAPVLL